MARRNHLDDFTRGRMTGKQEGRNITSVAAEFGINKSVVSRAWKAFQTTGTAVRKFGGGRPRTTTAGDDRYIFLQVKRGRWQSASVISQQLSTSTGRQVSRFAQPHRTLAVEELLESEDISRMDWPAYSPDLNPIEQVWDALGRRIAAHLHHPENTQQLKQMLLEEWALLPQEMLHQLVLSMRRRCEVTITVNKRIYVSMGPYLLTNRTTQKLAEGTKSPGMVSGIRFDHVYSDIPIS
ncbi:transposable element Tcb2 transposase [Trichonephila clavipes]|nr:transposable element Tcb2 transposase [Trichonephila clavipes]